MAAQLRGTKPTRILLVHGMAMEKYSAPATRAKWAMAIRACILRSDWGKENKALVPTRDEIDLVFWADLFKPPSIEAEEEISKGLADDLRQKYYEFLRGIMVFADKRATFGADGEPTGLVGRLVNSRVAQTVFYMQNSRFLNAARGAKGGAYDLIQARLRSKLTPASGGAPPIVIGHSLGSVIAYEGLCYNKPAVDTFITIGSPLATPYLIVQPLRERFARLIGRSTKVPLPFPDVRQWLSFYAPQDVWAVPVPSLRPLFANPTRLQEIEVPHGSTLKPHNTHKITAYLEADGQIGNALAAALDQKTARAA